MRSVEPCAHAQCSQLSGPAVVGRSARHGAVRCVLAPAITIVRSSVRRVDLVLPAGAQQKVSAGGNPQRRARYRRIRYQRAAEHENQPEGDVSPPLRD